eukprot:9504165-Pyramimonas_sp.AAC.2
MKGNYCRGAHFKRTLCYDVYVLTRMGRRLCLALWPFGCACLFTRHLGFGLGWLGWLGYRLLDWHVVYFCNIFLFGRIEGTGGREQEVREAIVTVGKSVRVV